MITWDDIWRFVRVLLRWWLVLFMAVALASGTAYLLVRRQPNYYVAHVSLMVGDNFKAAAPNQLAFGLSNTLASFYSELARREVILSPIVAQLQLRFPWQVLSDQMLTTSVNQQANLLEIGVTDSNPERAAAIANAIAEHLVRYSPTAPEKIAAQQAAIDDQLKQADINLKDTDQKIVDLQLRQKKLDAAIDLRDNQAQIDELQKARDRYQASYNQLLLLQNNSSVNSLAIFERSTVPTTPLPTRKTLTVGMAGFGGLLLAIVAILLLDLLDDRWRTGRDLRDRMGIRDLGRVPAGVAGAQSNAAVRERAMRDAHTHILLAVQGRPARMLLVSSPEPSTARSAFSVDLADIFARSGHRVLLVDADLSAAHLTALLEHQGQAAQPDAGTTSIDLWSRWQQSTAGNDFWSRLQITPLNNVRLLSSRRSSGNLPMLVPSLHWPALVDALKQYADVVIFDGPSVLNGPDAALLAPLVDGVVLTLDPQCDTRAAIVETKERLLLQPGARLLGAVVAPDARRVASPATKRGISISVQLGPRGGIRGVRLSRRAPAEVPAPQPHSQGVAAPFDPEPYAAVVNAPSQAPIVTPPAPTDEPLVTPPPAPTDEPLVTPPPVSETALLVAEVGAESAPSNQQSQSKKRAGATTPRARRKRATDTTDFN